MATSTYDRAMSVDEALATLGEHGFDAKVLAGGQSLIPMMSLGLARPARLVDIGRIPGLDRIDLGDEIRIGALVRHAHLAHPPAALERTAPLLPAAAPWIGHEAIRARGTFCGSIAHGDPAAEWPAVAVALDAVVEVRSRRGERAVPATDFFAGPLTTVLDEDELVTAVRLPAAPPQTGAAVLELAYRHGDYAVVGVAAQVTLGDGAGRNAPGAADGTPFEDVRIGLFGVGGTPIRARGAEAIARGGASAYDDAGQAAAAESDPVSDATASAAYRRRMTAVFVRRALALAAARAAGEADPAVNGGRT